MSQKFIRLLSLCLVILQCSNSTRRPAAGGSVRIAWTGGLIGADPQKDWGCAQAIKIIRWIYSPLYSPERPELGITQSFFHSSNYAEWVFKLKKIAIFTMTLVLLVTLAQCVLMM